MKLLWAGFSDLTTAAIHFQCIKKNFFLTNNNWWNTTHGESDTNFSLLETCLQTSPIPFYPHDRKDAEGLPGPAHQCEFMGMDKSKISCSSHNWLLCTTQQEPCEWAKIHGRETIARSKQQERLHG